MQVQKWAYAVLELSAISSQKQEEQLDELGEDGWELVAVVCTVPPLGQKAYLKKQKV